MNQQCSYCICPLVFFFFLTAYKWQPHSCSRSFSDFVDTWADSVFSTHSVLIQWPCYLNWASNGSEIQTQIITALTTSPPGWVWHISVNVRWQSWQCSQNLCEPFLRAVLPMIVKVGHSSNSGRWETKALITPPARWVSAPEFIHFGQHTRVIMMV